MGATCRFCGFAPREGDNMRLVMVTPGQPHWDALAADEPPEQTSITVPVCFDCQEAYSVDYFGLPPEALGARPAWPKSRECQFCHMPFRQGEYATLARVLPDNPQWEQVGEEGQPSVTVPICGECRADFWPVYRERLSMPDNLPAQAGPRHFV